MLRSSYSLGVLAVGIALSTFGRGTVGGQTSGRTVTLERTVHALQRGIVPAEGQSPDSLERQRRDGVQRIATTGRVGTAGAAYVPGRVLVKFKDGASSSARTLAVSAASASARVTRATLSAARPSHANFDTLAIGELDDPEAVANALRQRTEVECTRSQPIVFAGDSSPTTGITRCSGTCH